MRIGILSRNSKLYSIRRLKRAAALQGHEVQFINLMRCSAYVDTGDHKVLYGAREIGELDVLLPRIGTTVTQYGVTIVRHFENSGVLVNIPNGATGYLRDVGFGSAEVATRAFPVTYGNAADVIAFNAAWGWDEREVEEMDPQGRTAFEEELAGRLAPLRTRDGLRDEWTIHLYRAWK